MYIGMERERFDFLSRLLLPLLLAERLLPFSAAVNFHLKEAPFDMRQIIHSIQSLLD
jgi:hypothetical protein